MSYRWRCDPHLGPAELAAAGLQVDFEDQVAAEEWLSGYYEDLIELGVTQVSLFESDRLVYGPMPLDA